MADILRKENHLVADCKWHLEKVWRGREPKCLSGPPINRTLLSYQDPGSRHVSKHGLLNLVIGINTGLLLTSYVTLTGLHKHLMLHRLFNFTRKMGITIFWDVSLGLIDGLTIWLICTSHYILHQSQGFTLLDSTRPFQLSPHLPDCPSGNLHLYSLYI